MLMIIYGGEKLKQSSDEVKIKMLLFFLKVSAPRIVREERQHARQFGRHWRDIERMAIQKETENTGS